MKQLLLPILAGLFIYSCSSTSQIKKRYTTDDKTVFDLIERLKKNPNDDEAAKLLPEAYKQAAELRKNINKNTYANMSEGDRWIEISKQLQVAEQMYAQIKANPAANKAIPNPWDPTLRIQEAKQKAAEEYYNEGERYMVYNNRPYARKAYDMFVKANSAYPSYKDVRDRMEIALEASTVKVIVRPVNYYNYDWGYWGFNNDWMQYKLISDLNSNSSYRNVRFYTEEEAMAKRIQVDRVVDLIFNDIYVGQIYNDNSTIKRSKEIETGQTKTDPPKPIYTTVTATVYVNKRILQSRASLHCRIYDRASGRNFFADRFRDDFTWKEEKARYTGDSRALEPSDKALIANNNNQNPPSRNEIAERLINNCYTQLLARIKSGVSFDY